MLSDIRRILLQPLRHLRKFMTAEVLAADIEGDDEIRKARVYGGLIQLAQRGPIRDEDVGMSEFRVYSQNGEDGVLGFLRERLSIGSGFFVEIGAWRREANCLLLALHEGWEGVFVDGDPIAAAQLSDLMQHNRRVRVVNEMITSANIEDVLSRADVPRQIDVLSVDVNGQDYYLWASLQNVRARIVVIEYNSALDPTRAIVEPPDSGVWDGSPNFGCSVGALEKLARAKGYALAYLESSGTNAFLVPAEDASKLALPRVIYRSPNYHFRVDARYSGKIDAKRFVEV